MRAMGIGRATTLLALGIVSGSLLAADLTPKQQLGKAIFFDTALSINGNQACAACHDPAWGWTGPDPAINAAGAAYEGSIAGRFGNRKPPSSAYATLSPLFHFDEEEELFVGGNFWDGRATGEKLGNPAADQAQGPFLNPLEQALPGPADVVQRVCDGTYGDLFRQVYPGSCAPGTVDADYDRIALAIAAYEDSAESNAFTSKFDAYLEGRAQLSRLEKQGMHLFMGKGKCAACHVLADGKGKGIGRGRHGGRALLTDFTFDNLGLPRNPDNPFYDQAAFNPDGRAWVDLGLGDFLASRPVTAGFAADNYGKHKVPTLRNVDLRVGDGTKAFGHNGYFKSLEQIVHFYNTRDAKPACEDNPATTVDESIFLAAAEAIASGCWPQAEVMVNVNDSELGDLKLTPQQEAAIVAFMRALSDGYVP